MNVLFLSVSAGGGHARAAEAVKETVEERFPGSKCLIVDTLKYVSPVVDKLVIGSYLNSIKATPQIYGKLYELAESGENIYDFSNAVNKFLSIKIRSLIEGCRPDIIVCTHAFPLQMMSILRRKNAVNVPTVGILTDFVTHPFWLHDYIDAYVVSNDYMKFEMVNKGIPAEMIHPYGIPITQDFLKRNSRESILKDFGLYDGRLTILVMGGSLGFGEIRKEFKSLLKSKRDLQLIVVTGRNTRLKKQLEKYSVNSTKKVVLLSYTNRVADLMSVSDTIITKPGGMTLSESLVSGLPILIISPIPGQEERNAQFLINYGAAVRLYENDNVDNVLFQVIDNPIRTRHMKEMAQYLARPNATSDTVELLARIVGV